MSLSINRPVTEKIPAPRNAYAPFPYGASMGEPGAINQQMTILRDLLLLAKNAREPGAIVDLPYRWKRSGYSVVTAESFGI